LEKQNKSFLVESEELKALRSDIVHLKQKLEKEVAFAEILEEDTAQMSQQLICVDNEMRDLEEKYDRDVNGYKGKVDALQKQLYEKEAENLELKRELGRVMIENKRLQEQQSSMHREFFFSMAISIKLSLASKGIYSNADLNMLYEQILFVEYKKWNKWLEEKLNNHKLEDKKEIERNRTTPLATPTRRVQPKRSARKKKLFGLF